MENICLDVIPSKGRGNWDICVPAPVSHHLRAPPRWGINSLVFAVDEWVAKQTLGTEKALGQRNAGAGC